MNKDSFLQAIAVIYTPRCGDEGIRTLEALASSRFPGVCNRPLCDISVHSTAQTGLGTQVLYQENGI